MPTHAACACGISRPCGALRTRHGVAGGGLARGRRGAGGPQEGLCGRVWRPAPGDGLHRRGDGRQEDHGAISPRGRETADLRPRESPLAHTCRRRLPGLPPSLAPPPPLPSPPPPPLPPLPPPFPRLSSTNACSPMRSSTYTGSTRRRRRASPAHTRLRLLGALPVGSTGPTEGRPREGAEQREGAGAGVGARVRSPPLCQRRAEKYFPGGGASKARGPRRSGGGEVAAARRQRTRTGQGLACMR